ncbi:MAG TPA: histidinol-phosphate transaminase [Desulfotomaculum sp.]|nr:histidinol-phosphate transaminase [Desulfotomaculum sp.]
MAERVRDLVRPDLRDLIPYAVPHYPGYIKLDANENPYDFSSEVLIRIFQKVGGQTFTRYPDPMAADLRRALAGYTGLAPGNILAGNGSDELILTLLLTFGSGGGVIITPPTFSMYKIHARIAGAVTVEVPRLKDFAPDVPAIIRAARAADVKLVILCSPNNPTGNVVSRDGVEALLSETAGLVLLDEAYAEFAGESCADLVPRYPRLVVLRTFSKAFGLAGLRVGYLLSDETVISELLKVKQPFNLNAFSQLAALTVLEHLPVFEERIQRIIAGRRELYHRLKEIPGVEVFPSRANFLLFRTPLPAVSVYEGLLKHRVLIRNVEGPGLERCLRVNVGTPEENETFVKALVDVVS